MYSSGVTLRTCNLSNTSLTSLYQQIPPLLFDLLQIITIGIIYKWALKVKLLFLEGFCGGEELYLPEGLGRLCPGGISCSKLWLSLWF